MRRPIGVVVAVALVLAACGSGDGRAGDAYELTEYAITGATSRPAGTVSLTVSNSGDFPHTLVIADESGQVVAATDLILSGETVTLEVDLAPGTFQFTCRIVAETPDGDIVDHFEAGMVETVEVARG